MPTDSYKSVRELFNQLLDKLASIEERLVMLETGGTLVQNALARHGRRIEELNRRCIERLGKLCPLNGLDSDNEQLGQGKLDGEGSGTTEREPSTAISNDGAGKEVTR